MINQSIPPAVLCDGEGELASSLDVNAVRRRAEDAAAAEVGIVLPFCGGYRRSYNERLSMGQTLVDAVTA